jgi:hypothetical protein
LNAIIPTFPGLPIPGRSIQRFCRLRSSAFPALSSFILEDSDSHNSSLNKFELTRRSVQSCRYLFAVVWTEIGCGLLGIGPPRLTAFVGHKVVDKVGYLKDIATVLNSIGGLPLGDRPTRIFRRLMRVTS